MRKTLLGIICSGLIFSACSDNTAKKAISSAGNGVNIDYKQITSANFLSKNDAERYGIEKPAETFFSRYEIYPGVKGVWCLNNNKNIVVYGQYDMFQKMVPGDNFKDMFAVPCEKNNKIYFYIFADNDTMKALNDKEFKKIGGIYVKKSKVFSYDDFENSQTLISGNDCTIAARKLNKMWVKRF